VYPECNHHRQHICSEYVQDADLTTKKLSRPGARPFLGDVVLDVGGGKNPGKYVVSFKRDYIWWDPIEKSSNEAIYNGFKALETATTVVIADTYPEAPYIFYGEKLSNLQINKIVFRFDGEASVLELEGKLHDLDGTSIRFPWKGKKLTIDVEGALHWEMWESGFQVGNDPQNFYFQDMKFKVMDNQLKIEYGARKKAFT
jgi:hypothetical protein